MITLSNLLTLNNCNKLAIPVIIDDRKTNVMSTSNIYIILRCTTTPIRVLSCPSLMDSSNSIRLNINTNLAMALINPRTNSIEAL